MPTLEISSPVDGSAVLENQSFQVGVQWEPGIMPVKRKKATASPLFTVTCSAGSSTQNFPTDSMPGSTTFGFSVGAAGTTTVVNASLKDNGGNVLASNSVTVHAVSLMQGGGSIGGGTGLAAMSGSRSASGKVFVCGKYDASRTTALVCITYQVVNDKTVPRDGSKTGPPFTVSKRIKRVRQYSLVQGNLKLEGGTTGFKIWQVTAPSSLIGVTPAPNQFGVWFLDSTGNVISQASAPLDTSFRVAPCLP